MTGLAALVLSGGASSRFGGSPKALLPADERSGVRRIVDLAGDAGCDPIVVVVGPHHGPIGHELRGTGVRLVEAEDWFEGRTASVQAGLRALPDPTDLFFWPVDHPFVSRRTVDTLTTARSRDPLAVWFVPSFEGRGGHPVVWRPPVRDPILELRPDAPLRSLLPQFGPQVRRIPVDDPGVVANVDTLESYRSARDAFIARRES